MTITGPATMEESGHIHEMNLNGGNSPKLDAEVERVERLSQRWKPASVVGIAAISGCTIHRHIRL